MSKKIYYTNIEIGNVMYLPEKIDQEEAVEELKKNRIKDKKTGICLSVLHGWHVHSVFFVENYKIMHIWDSSLNDYRPEKFINIRQSIDMLKQIEKKSKIITN